MAAHTPRALVAAMTTHAASPDMTAAGCRTLARLALDHDIFRMAIAKVGGLDAVLAGMRRFAAVPDVQAQACRALWNLSSNADNKVSIRRPWRFPPCYPCVGSKPSCDEREVGPPSFTYMHVCVRYCFVRAPGGDHC